MFDPRIISVVFFATAMFGCSQRTTAPHQRLWPASFQQNLDRRYLGLTKAQVVEKTKLTSEPIGDLWVVWDHLAPGFYSDVPATEFVFKHGRVVEIRKTFVAVGCVIIAERPTE